MTVPTPVEDLSVSIDRVVKLAVENAFRAGFEAGVTRGRVAGIMGPVPDVEFALRHYQEFLDL